MRVQSAYRMALLFFLAGCAIVPPPQERKLLADSIADKHGWHSQRFNVGQFELIGYLPTFRQSSDTLAVYIEGDGFAWQSRSTPSGDPTPTRPVALELAVLHKGDNAVYLARPCQYVGVEKTGCSQRYWTYGRFAPEVIEAMDLAIDKLKRELQAESIVLVGYSGGGNVAALVAARRFDVKKLITVAGNLDHKAWADHHRVAALRGSLSAADFADQLRNLPQIHFVGEQDRVMPSALAQSWPEALTGKSKRNLRVILGADHECCWEKTWKQDIDVQIGQVDRP